jgi:mRNA interferase MazF
MTQYKVVLVPFPFDDLSNNKVRPAVCLTNPTGPHHHVVLAFITSRIPDDPLPTDIIIQSSETDFITTGLRVSSTLCLHRMVTATTKLIRRDLGKMPSRLQKQIDIRLKALFELE